MNNIMKLLTVSAISCAVIANSEATNAQTACVKPVQGFVSIGLFGSQSKIKGDVNLSKLKGYTNSAVLKEIGSKYLDKTEFEKLWKDALKVEFSNPEKQEKEIKLYEINGAGDWESGKDVIKQSIITEKNDDDDKTKINVTSTFDWLGNKSAVPVGSKYESIFEADKARNYANVDFVSSNNQAFDNNGKPISVYDAEHPAPTITQQIKVSADSIKNPGDLYQIALNDSDGSEKKNSWLAKGWQLSGYANVGLLVNLPLGGSWYLSFFGMKPFVNSNQNITFGANDNSSNDEKNKSGFNVKNKGTLGFETGLRCSMTDKVWLGVGGGVQRTWYGISFNGSSENDNSNNNSNSEVQNMKGDAFFAKLSLGFNVTNNIGIETFAKYTAKHNLKTSTSKKKSNSDNNDSAEFPMDFSNPGALSFGVACTFTF